MNATTKRRRRLWLSACAATAVAAAGAVATGAAQLVPASADTPSASAGESGGRCQAPGIDAYGDRGDLFVLTDDNRLYRMDQAGKGRAERSVPISGLAAGERLVGLDTRPANGQLYAVGDTSQLYVVDPASGAAAKVGPTFSTPLQGNRFGVDFNPTVDRLRIVSDSGQNLRVDPTTGAVAAVDTPLSFDGGAPASSVSAAGYTNSVAGATSTALYDIDTGSDALVLQGTKPGVTPAVSPNTGRLFRVGSLGVDAIGLNGFDIIGAASGPMFDEDDYTALAALRLRGDDRSVLARINLKTGKTTVRAKLDGRVVGLTASAGASTTVFATTSANELVRFDRRSPQKLDSVQPITGLAAGETVAGIDFRPANGRLYLLGSTDQLYVVDLATAAASPVGGPITPSLAGTLVGFDFNPSVDRIRVVTTGGQNLRLNPDTGAVASVDGALKYDAGDRNAAFRANVSHAAYTNNQAGAATTTLNDIDAPLDILATQQPPNDGTLRTAGRLGADTDGRGGFDIAADGVALAALTPAGAADSASSRLYCVDLSTGKARPMSRIGDGRSVAGLAIAPRGVFARS